MSAPRSQTAVERYMSLLAQLDPERPRHHPRELDLASRCEALWNRMTDEEQAEVSLRCLAQDKK